MTAIDYVTSIAHQPHLVSCFFQFEALFYLLMRHDGKDHAVCCFTALVPLVLERVRTRRLATLSVTASQCDV